MKDQEAPQYCPECGADLSVAGFMTEEHILGTTALVKVANGIPRFVVTGSETAIQIIMCGECGDDISDSFPGFVIQYK